MAVVIAMVIIMMMMMAMTMMTMKGLDGYEQQVVGGGSDMKVRRAERIVWGGLYSNSVRYARV